MDRLHELIDPIRRIAEDAGRAILEIRDTWTSTKADGSPVTAADAAADTLIRESLQRISEHPIVSEEDAESHRRHAGVFWLVDPLDGTKELLKASGEFTVNIALIENGAAVLGVVHAPALNRSWCASSKTGTVAIDESGRAALLEPPAIRIMDRPLRLAVSRDHLTTEESQLIETLENIQPVPRGSSLKFCMVAEDVADAYLRVGTTMEWDTAAAQCVAERAGCRVTDLGGQPLRYAKENLRNPSFLVVRDPSVARQILDHLQSHG
ncbi:MAG: 3'(2'),5'-bisphosphate nucleotidase CysQ [Thermoanaerobaculia bacterium]